MTAISPPVEVGTDQDLAYLALTNYGHFTSMRVESSGGVRGLSLHLERLSRDSEAVFGTPIEPDVILDRLREALTGQVCPLTARVTVFDPALTMGDLSRPSTPRMMVTTRPAGQMPSPPLTAKSFRFSRDLPYVKHIGLFSQLRLRRAAQTAGFDDAVFLEADGRFSEGATWNLGFIDGDGHVVWPDGPVLPGVTMRILQGSGVEMSTEPVTLAGATRMRAAFATNVSVGVRAIQAIDGHTFAVADSALDRLRAAYAAAPVEPLLR